MSIKEVYAYVQDHSFQTRFNSIEKMDSLFFGASSAYSNVKGSRVVFDFIRKDSVTSYQNISLEMLL